MSTGIDSNKLYTILAKNNSAIDRFMPHDHFRRHMISLFIFGSQVDISQKQPLKKSVFVSLSCNISVGSGTRKSRERAMIQLVANFHEKLAAGSVLRMQIYETLMINENLPVDGVQVWRSTVQKMPVWAYRSQYQGFYFSWAVRNISRCDRNDRTVTRIADSKYEMIKLQNLRLQNNTSGNELCQVPCRRCVHYHSCWVVSRLLARHTACNLKHGKAHPLPSWTGVCWVLDHHSCFWLGDKKLCEDSSLVHVSLDQSRF